MKIKTFNTSLVFGLGIVELPNYFIINNKLYDLDLKPLPINRQILKDELFSYNPSRPPANNHYASMPLLNNRIITRSIRDRFNDWRGIVSVYNVSQEPHKWHGFSITDTDYGVVTAIPNGSGYKGITTDNNILNLYNDMVSGVAFFSRINNSNFIAHILWGNESTGVYYFQRLSPYQTPFISFQGYGTIQFLGRSSNYMYFASSDSNAGHRIIRYNLSSDSVTTIDTETRVNTWKCLVSHPINDPKTEGISRFYRFYTNLSNITANLFTLNLNTSTVTKQAVTINGGGTSFAATLPNWEDNIIFPFIHKYNNELYVSFITVRTRGSSQLNSTEFNGHGYIYTYKINENNPTQINFITSYRFTSDEIWGFFFMDNEPDITNLTNQRNKLVIGGNSATYFVTFNGNNWQINTIPGKPITVMMDRFDRIFLLRDDWTLTILKEDLPYIININPEKPNYYYNGTNINTYIDIDTYNYQNQRVPVTGTLHILGNNATFDDGTIMKQITTSANSTTRIPIIVTNTGPLNIRFTV